MIVLFQVIVDINKFFSLYFNGLFLTLKRLPPQAMAQSFQRGPSSINGEPVAPPVSMQYSVRNPPPRQFGPTPGARAVRPRSDSYVRNGGFKRANFENLRILTYEEIQKNMELR
jgi:hypothetical protein